MWEHYTGFGALLQCMSFIINRWGRLRASMMPFPGLLEPLTESMVLGMIGCVMMYYVLNVHPIVFLVCHFLFWFICDMILLRIIQVTICNHVCLWTTLDNCIYSCMHIHVCVYIVILLCCCYRLMLISVNVSLCVYVCLFPRNKNSLCMSGGLSLSYWQLSDEPPHVFPSWYLPNTFFCVCLSLPLVCVWVCVSVPPVVLCCDSTILGHLIYLSFDVVFLTPC